jgi:hypothetical protein
MLIKSACFKIAPCHGYMQPVKSAGPLKIIKIYRKLQISIEIWINEMKKKGWGGGKRRCVKCLAMAVLH